MTIGADFGTTPFGVDAVRAWAERKGRLALWPNEDRRRSCGVCLLELFPVVDVSCPEHGLEAFVRETFAEAV